MSEKIKLTKKQQAQEFSKMINELEAATDVEGLIQNNQIKFKVNDIQYRVRKLSLEEQNELENYRRKKYLEFLKDDTMLFRKQWIEIYKKKDIDILKMEQEMKDLQSKVESLLLRLAQTTIKKDIEILKKEITELREKQALINIEKTDKLAYSIEDQLLVVSNSYYAYASLEKFEKDKWVNVFNSFEDFMNSKNSPLINQSFYNVNFLIYQSPL